MRRSRLFTHSVSAAVLVLLLGALLGATFLGRRLHDGGDSSVMLSSTENLPPPSAKLLRAASAAMELEQQSAFVSGVMLESNERNSGVNQLALHATANDLRNHEHLQCCVPESDPG